MNSAKLPSLETVPPETKRVEIGNFRNAVRHEMRAVFVISAFVNLLLLTSSVYMLQVLDRVLSSGSLGTLFYLTVIAIVALAAYGLLEMARRQILNRVGAFCDRTLMPELLDRMIVRNAGGDRSASGALASLSSVRSFLSGENILAFIDAPWTPLFLVVIAMIHPVLGLVALAGVIVLFIVTLINDRIARPLSLKEKAASEKTTDRLRNALAASETVAALHLRAPVVEATRSDLEARYLNHRRDHDAMSSAMATSRFLRFCLQIAILGVGAWLVVLGQMTAGGMIAASILLSRAVAPVERSMSAWQSMVLARQGWADIKAIMSAPIEADNHMRLPDPKGELTFNNLTIGASGADQPLLKDLAGRVEPGSVLVVIGASGSGKSTLARTIAGVHSPETGSVALDGVDVRKWQPAQFGRWLGYLPQTVDLLAGTIAQNISRFSEQPDEKAIVAAARMAGIHEFIGSLDNGYNTPIGPEGRRLSVGQAQRIAIARAFYDGPKLVVLDEPTSAQDSNGTNNLREAVTALRTADAAVILITHDRTLISLADQVLHLQDGKGRFLEVQKEQKPVGELSSRIAEMKRRRASGDIAKVSTGEDGSPPSA
ncbi:MAG: type I secretion system permease/ATPase [Pseudomonadota bacterium]